MKLFNLKKGFTLAEVLITLAVIGVVAALAIPALLTTTNEAEYKTLYKKAYSNLSKALIDANRENLLKPMVSNTDQANLDNFLELKTRFIVTKECTSGDNSECWASGELYRSTPLADSYAFIDNSGMAYTTRRGNVGGGANLAIILVDVNGSKPPNKIGKDRFPIYFYNINDDTIKEPIKIKPHNDVVSSDINCPSGNCKFTSWLLE